MDKQHFNKIPLATILSFINPVDDRTEWQKIIGAAFNYDPANAAAALQSWDAYRGVNGNYEREQKSLSRDFQNMPAGYLVNLAKANGFNAPARERSKPAGTQIVELTLTSEAFPCEDGANCYYHARRGNVKCVLFQSLDDYMESATLDGKENRRLKLEVVATGTNFRFVALIGE